uniref:Uncharacterized protein n=1 Tax=Panagrolaimus sp. JU765 TaxID=591449 RepID=A0AC34QTR7_9BILA
MTFLAGIEADPSLNSKCRDLLTCAIKKQCVQLNFLVKSFQGANISAQLYNDLDKGIDYGCIFTAGCLEECNRCPFGDFRNRINMWEGHCYEMFREIVYKKFETEFDNLGIRPAIGIKIKTQA